MSPGRVARPPGMFSTAGISPITFSGSCNSAQARNAPNDPAVEAVLHSYELAWRMQSQAPAVLDLASESPSTLALYGIGEKGTDEFGRQCLAARRLCEAGVRFVQVTYGDNTANPRWDQHSDLPRHAIHAQATDKPIAGH